MTDSKSSTINSDLRDFVNLVIGGRYITQKLLGEGGWSVVYQAFDKTLGREVAVKLLHKSLAVSPENIRRFENEARAASTLNHTNIGAIYDYGVLPCGQPFIVMELLVGETLSQRIEKQAAIPVSEALNIITQVAFALSHAHKKGILHRDIKPSNIIVLRDNADGLQVKLVDFGLAKWMETDKIATLTESGVAVGTPSYMSPEQCKCKKVDHRSDIYSLGCTLYELLSGVKPFQGSVLDCLHAHMLKDAPPLNSHSKNDAISPAIENVLRKAMAKNPERRIANADAFVEELRTAAGSKGRSLLPLWWQISQSWKNSGKFWIPFAASLTFLLTIYFAGPNLLNLAGVRTIEIDAAQVDPQSLDEMVKEITRAGKLSLKGQP